MRQNWAFCITHLVSSLPSQFFQQDLCVLEIGRVKALATLRCARGDPSADVPATIPHAVALERLALDGWPPGWPGDS